MTNQLSIPCEVVNQSGYGHAKAEYEKSIRLKNLHPVYLVANTKTSEYFTTTFFSKKYIESFSNFRILE